MKQIILFSLLFFFSANAGLRYLTPLKGLSFTPNSIAGCTLWLDGADAASMTIVSNLISSWTNKGNSALGVAATELVNKPTYVTNVQNGKSVVRFARGQILSLGANNYTPLNSPWTVTIVSGNRAFSGTNYMIQFSSAVGTAGNPFVISNDAGYRYIAFGQTTTQLTQRTTTVIGAEYFTYSIKYGGSNPTTGGSYSINLKGSADTLTSSGGLSGFSSGLSSVGGEASQFNSSFNLSGDILEIIIYNSSLGSTDQASLNSYIATKWGL